MRRILLSLLLCAQSAQMSLATDAVFHTASLGDHRSVRLSLVGGGHARDPAFDFDVVVALSEFDDSGAELYRDGGRHEASVRCTRPARVRVQSIDYWIDISAHRGTDWKFDLWATLCTAPLS